MSSYRIAQIAEMFNGWRRVLKLTIDLPDGRSMEREVLDTRSHAASVLPYDPVNRTLILIRQYRASVAYKNNNGFVVETIAGLLDGDAPDACARREAMEEGGVRLDKLEPLGQGWSAPGATTESVYLFLAPYTPEARVTEGGGLKEEHEDIQVLELSFDEAETMLDEHRFEDLKTILLVQALKLRHPHLFRSGPKAA
jgi:nudix-type nucleoside diphosphatase (YffH/AdpP family)